VGYPPVTLNLPYHHLLRITRFSLTIFPRIALLESSQEDVDEEKQAAINEPHSNPLPKGTYRAYDMDSNNVLVRDSDKVHMDDRTNLEDLMNQLKSLNTEKRSS